MELSNCDAKLELNTIIIQSKPGLLLTSQADFHQTPINCDPLNGNEFVPDEAALTASDDEALKDEAQVFEHVQLSGLFRDSKTFADAVPLRRASLKEVTACAESVEALKSLIQDRYLLPAESQDCVVIDASTVEDYIRRYWPEITKRFTVLQGSLFALPFPHVVPGSRFREMYYWDSYFTAIGLAADGLYEPIEDMVLNFCYLIEKLGYVPNGNRTYYEGRSQMPVLVFLIELLEKSRNIDTYIPFLAKELEFWNGTSRRVELDGGEFLNRYWSDITGPRPEALKEDLMLGRDESIHREIRAACESGWDFSSRWMQDADDLSSLDITSLCPVDLNCVLLKAEDYLAKYYKKVGETERSNAYSAMVESRSDAINKYLWNEEHKCYFDYNWKKQSPSLRVTAACVAPLFVHQANFYQAQCVCDVVCNKLLMEGGVATTTVTSPKQQWDGYNGWAPLQWMVYVGMINYGMNNIAEVVARKWVNTVETGFRKYNTLFEKYNVATMEPGVGGEYVVQSGFGWTNGVTLALIQALKLQHYST